VYSLFVPMTLPSPPAIMLINLGGYSSTSRPSYAFRASKRQLSEATSTTATSPPTQVTKTPTGVTNALSPPATPSAKPATEVQAPSQTSHFKVDLESASQESANIQRFLSALQGLRAPNKLIQELQVEVDLTSAEAERVLELADYYGIRCGIIL
jgi:hypothetical protein